MQKTRGIFSAKGAILIAAGLLCLAFTTVTITNRLSAGFSEKTLSAYIEIDGGQFGAFEQIRNIEDITKSITHSDSDYTIVSLKRDFITERSLYVWAKETVQKRKGLKDVHLIMKDDKGNEVSRYILKLCQPLSWSIEAADPAMGGFHEKIDLAVQEIAIH